MIAVVVVWLLSDAAAAVGVRRLVLDRRPVLAAWLLGWGELVRRPQRSSPRRSWAGVPRAAAGPALAASAVGWPRVRDILVDGRDPVVVAGAVAIWVAIWLGGLVLAGVGAAFRAAAWTLEVPLPREREPRHRDRRRRASHLATVPAR